MAIFVPAVVSYLRFFEEKEIRAFELALPHDFEVGGRRYPIADRIRPGNAFLAKPFGARTKKWQPRLYTRSNFGPTRILQSIVNDTHEAKADTSPWWQTEDMKVGSLIDVRVDLSPDKTELRIYEHKGTKPELSVELESDDWWPTQKFVAIAFSTGITPFLAHLRYMASRDFGRGDGSEGTHYVLIASVRNPRQLMYHGELSELEKNFPKNFQYHPVLTREWPEDWPYTRGRIVKAEQGSDGEVMNMGPLFAVVQDIETRHVRMCGNETARDQLILGFEQSDRKPLSFKAEVW